MVPVLLEVFVPFIKGEGNQKSRFSFEHSSQNFHQILRHQFSFPEFIKAPDDHFCHPLPLNRGVFLGVKALYKVRQCKDHLET